LAPVGAVTTPTATVTGGTVPAPNVTAPNVASVAAPAQVTARDVSGDETVAGQLNSLLDKNSTYLQSARNRGMEAANQRGLINSSLAAGTAERSAIDAALPIAQQDANTFAASGQSAQNANQDLGLTSYKSLLDSAQQRENFGYTTAENEQNIKANTALQDDRLKSQADLQTQAEASALQQQSQQQQANLALQTTLKNMDVKLDLQKLDATARDALTTAVSPIIQQVQSEIAQIQRTPNSTLSPDAKATAIAAQNEYLRANIQTISTLYGYRLDWPTTSSPAVYQPPPPAPEPAPVYSGEGG
jgi:hypothetical protein